MTAEIESLSRQIAFKESEERRVRDEIGEYQRRIEAVPGLESEWAALTRDYETQQLAYKDLLSKSEASKVAVDLEQQQIGEHFRIVDPAGVPVHPRPSIRRKINAGGLALGLLLGLGIAALLEVQGRVFSHQRRDRRFAGLAGTGQCALYRNDCRPCPAQAPNSVALRRRSGLPLRGLLRHVDSEALEQPDMMENV